MRRDNEWRADDAGPVSVNRPYEAADARSLYGALAS